MLTKLHKLFVRRIHLSYKLAVLNDVDTHKPSPLPMSYNIYNDSVDPKAPPIVIMHGLFGSKSNWNSLSKALNHLTGRQIITVDARNHGESPHSDEFSYYHLVEDVGNLLRNLNLSRASLMGHSMGGRAMMLYSLTYPETVEKLIVVDVCHKNPGIQLTGMKKYFDALRSVNLNGNLSLSAGRKEADKHLSSFIPEMEVRQFLLTNLLKDEGIFKWRLNLDALEEGFDNRITNFPKVTGTYAGPTLFIGGRKSAYLKEEDHEDIKKMFPSVIFEYLDAGHWVHAEKPHELLELVKNFIKFPVP